MRVQRGKILRRQNHSDMHSVRDANKIINEPLSALDIVYKASEKMSKLRTRVAARHARLHLLSAFHCLIVSK